MNLQKLNTIKLFHTTTFIILIGMLGLIIFASLNIIPLNTTIPVAVLAIAAILYGLRFRYSP